MLEIEDLNGLQIGDVMGQFYLDQLHCFVNGQSDPYDCQILYILERDDGYVIPSSPATTYFNEPEDWLSLDRRSLDWVNGRVLDIGCGAGRAALALQERGVEVTALDISPGAIEVCRRRGVHDLVCGAVEEHAYSNEKYDTFLLFGDNLYLIGTPENVARFLSVLAEMASPGARIVGTNSDPYRMVGGPNIETYAERNLRLGRMAGQRRGRIRYKNIATPWFDFLRCSVEELDKLTRDTPWQVSKAEEDKESPRYLVELTLR